MCARGERERFRCACSSSQCALIPLDWIICALHAEVQHATDKGELMWNLLKQIKFSFLGNLGSGAISPGAAQKHARFCFSVPNVSVFGINCESSQLGVLL